MAILYCIPILLVAGAVAILRVIARDAKREAERFGMDTQPLTQHPAKRTGEAAVVGAARLSSSR
jgi:hypothetical protein